MQTLPIFLKLTGQSVLLVGDGEAAQAKIRLLTRTPAHMHVLGSPEKLGEFTENPRVKIEDRAFTPDDVHGHVLVYGATECAATDSLVALAAKQAGIPVNIVDRPDMCDFITPAVVDRDPVTVAISTNGASPVFGRRLRAQIEALLPPGTGPLMQAARSFRTRLKTLMPNGSDRRRFWDRLFDGQSLDRLATLDTDEMQAELERLATSNGKQEGRVLLVGAGPGDPDLLTLKAHRALQQGDIIIYDRLVGDGILDYARRDAERLYVGKARGEHSVPQAEINQLMIDHARAGKLVVRLKSGDPFMFGRAGEEIEDLTAAGISVEVVPGVTAAAGCAASALIPLTHRDHASAVTLMTGQLKRGASQSWTGLFGSGRTLAVYMGLNTARDIQDGLLADGADGDTPVAILENGTRPEERRFYTRLDGLTDMVTRHNVTSPALILIGQVARLAQDWPAEVLSVIASPASPGAAIQMDERKLDCFVASAPRNDVSVDVAAE